MTLLPQVRRVLGSPGSDVPARWRTGPVAFASTPLTDGLLADYAERRWFSYVARSGAHPAHRRRSRAKRKDPARCSATRPFLLLRRRNGRGTGTGTGMGTGGLLLP